MYEKHIFPDGTRIFCRNTNQYVLDSDADYHAWLNETEPVYTYETQQQEVSVTVIDPETGEETTTTELRDVTVAIPAMVTDEEGNEVQQTRKVHTIQTRNLVGDGNHTAPLPSPESRIAAIEMYLLDQEMKTL